MDPKCQATKHECSAQVEEVTNVMISKEEQYLDSNMLKNLKIKSNEFSETMRDEDSNESEQITEHENNNRNESQRPHGEEFLPTGNQCAVCDKIFHSQQLLIIHAIDDHPNDKVFKCADCSEVFAKIGALARHRKTHDDLPMKNVCDICFKVFKSNYHMKRHLNSHTEKPSYACLFCEKICKTEYLLQVHQKTHLKTESNNSCEFCSKSFDCLNNLKIHLRIAHNAERVRINKTQTPQNCTSTSQDRVKKQLLKSDRDKKNICKYCSKSFLRKDILKRHLMIHSGVRPYQCSICNKTYKDKRDLSLHQKIHFKQISKTRDKNVNISKSQEKNQSKMESNNYKTMDVSMQFADYILPHVPISLKEKEEKNILAPYSDTDSLELARKNESNTKYIYEEEIKPRAERLEDNIILKEHTFEKVIIRESQTNINEPQLGYKCAVCDEMFKFERDFIKHVKQLHHNGKAFKCRYCAKSFFNSSALSNHVKIHNDKNKLICGFCSKSFTCISYLNSHLEVHSVERPYTCSFCEKNYKYKRDLKKHEKKNHMGLSAMKKCHVCKFCSKTFDRPSMLDRHLKVHSKERPFSCALCGKSFKHNINLKSHQRICLQPTSEKPSQRKQELKNLHTKDLEQETNITIKCEANKETIYIKGPLDFDLSNKRCQNDKFSVDKKNESMNIKAKEIINSDDESTDDFDEGNTMEICKTEYKYDEVIQPDVKCSKDSSTKTEFQQNLITGKDNVISKSTTKLHGVKRHIQTTNKCAVCKKLFKFQRDLVKHAQEYHPCNKPLKCRYCKERFSNLQTLLRHSQIHKEITKKHRCEFCLKHFSTIGDLKSHLSKHYEDVYEKSFYQNKKLNQKSNTTDKAVKKSHICELCSKSFPTMFRLNLHLTSHTVGRPLVCSFCEKTFKHKSNLVYHEKTHMGFEKRFSCEICFKSFRSNSMLTRHFKFHTNERPYSCFQCNKTYKHKVDLKKHQKICLQSNSCSLCEKIFADSESLKSHQTVHYVNKCAVCDKMCNSQRDLVKHARQFHPKGKAFKCQTCSAVLSNKKSLNIHKKICLQLKSCAYCERIMADDDNFKRHLMMHYVNKCAVCEKVCKSQKDLIIHAQQSHPNGKAFKCPVCDKLYASKTPFNCHTRTHKDKLNGDFYMFLYEKNYKENIDFGFLKLIEESESNTTAREINQTIQNPINDLINENQYVSKSDETEFDSMNAEYLSDIEYVEEEVCQNDEDYANVLNSLDIEILYNKPQDDNLDAKIETDLSKTEFIDVEAIVHPVENLEDNSEKKEPKQEQAIEENSPVVIPAEPRCTYEPIVVKKKILTDNKCAVCHKIFKFQRDLIKHAQRYHRNTRPLKYQCYGARFSEKQPNKLKNKKHTCTFCSKSFTCQSDLKGHLKTHLPDPLAVKYPPSTIQITNTSDNDAKRKHICEICSKGFSNKYRLNRHLKAHTVERPYSCSLCGNNYKHEYTLREHEKTHLDFSISKHACELCYQTFSCASRLNRHLVVHTKERPFSCSICGKTFKHLHNMKVHETKHLGLDLIERTHVCEICSKVFAAERHLKRHLGVHTGERPYSCSMCDKVFKNKNGLNKHLQTHSNGELNEQGKQEIIKKCKKSTVKKERITKLQTNLNQPAMKRLTPSEYKCAVCDKVFNFRRDFIQHAKQFHRNAKAFRCGDCGRRFFNTQALASHTRIHTYYTHSGSSNNCEKENKNIYMCEFCSKSFNCMSLLHRHFKAHKVERPYTCSLCNKTYKHMNDLKMHKKSHVKTNTCEFCSKSFGRSDNLLRHLKLHDSNKCAICDVMCSSKLDLANHGKKFHPNDKVFKCQICGVLISNRILLLRHIANHKEDHSYSFSAYEKFFNKTISNLCENDLQESTPTTNITEDIDVVGTDDNRVISNNFETNEEIIVVDDFDHTERLFQNIEDNVVEETNNSINCQDIIEDLFIRIVTP